MDSPPICPKCGCHLGKEDVHWCLGCDYTIIVSSQQSRPIGYDIEEPKAEEPKPETWRDRPSLL